LGQDHQHQPASEKPVCCRPWACSNWPASAMRCPPN
jgi:hypothetical protein